MNIYVVDHRKNLGEDMARFIRQKKAVLLDKGSSDLCDYRELFEDPRDKVLAVNPTALDWKFPTEALEKIPNLKGICTKNSWAYYIDVAKAKELGVTISNCVGANSQSVAEYAIWMMLGLTRNLPLQMEEKFANRWDDRHVQVEVMGKTAGIVGLGNVGSRIAKMCQGLGMKVIYWNRSPKEVDFQKYTSVDRLVSEADVIFDCLETCKGTKGFFNKKRLAKMKKSAYFVSVMGGMGFGVEDDLYLLSAAARGKIAGFAIENEHEPKSKLPAKIKGNVLLVSANAWFTKEARARTDKMWTECALAAAHGRPINLVG